MRNLILLFLMVFTFVNLTYFSFSEEVSGEVSQASQQSSQQSSGEGPDFGFGLSFGTVVINGQTYFQIKGQPDFSFGLFGVGLDVNFEFDSSWSLRTTEWNSVQAVLSKIRYLRWGNKGTKPVYAKIGQIADATIGNGFIMWNYANNVNYPNIKKLGIALDLDFDYVGIETFVDNIWDFDIIATRLFARPLFGSQIPVIDMLELGGSFVADLDPLNPIPPTNSPYQFSDDPNSKPVFEVGTDLRVPLVNLQPVFNMVFFGDFAYILNKGTGESIGFFGNVVSLVPYRFEVRFLQPKFLPSFFDSLYDLQKYRIVGSNTYVTKYDDLDNITNSYAGWFFSSGVSFEKAVSLLVTIEDSFDDTTYPRLLLRFSIDKELSKMVGFDFIYDRRNIRELRDIYTTESTDAIVNARLTYKVSDNVNLIVNYTRSFDWFEENGQKVLKPLENTTISTEISF